MRSSCTEPATTCWARSRMEAALARLSPHEASVSGVAASTASGVTTPPNPTTRRPWIDAAALPASCW